MAYETDNLLTGKTSNPWNLAFSAGGSSGGEAAAIASGCSMGGVGSDGGGSVRTPAHFSGVCGLKPTPGRIPTTGHFPPGGGAFAWLGVVGSMARTVADLRTLFEVLAGPDAGDSLSAPVPVRHVDERKLRGVRIGILENPELGRATPETLSTIRRAAQHLCDLNYRVEPVTLKQLDRALELWWFFFGPVVADLIRHSTKDQESLLSPMLREYLASAVATPPTTLDSFMNACSERDSLRADLLRQLRDVPNPSLARFDGSCISPRRRQLSFRRCPQLSRYHALLPVAESRRFPRPFSSLRPFSRRTAHQCATDRPPLRRRTSSRRSRISRASPRSVAPSGFIARPTKILCKIDL